MKKQGGRNINDKLYSDNEFLYEHLNESFPRESNKCKLNILNK